MNRYVRPALLLVCLLVSTAHAAPAHLPIPIGVARLLPLGTHVTVVGAVSTPSGTFASSFFDNGFGLEDLFAGIYVSAQTDFDVAPGMRARVEGVLADQFGLLVIIPDDDSAVTDLGPSLPVLPRPVATAHVSEQTEGLIVQVRGRITDGPTDDAPYGFKFSVDDGSGPISIFINDGAGIAITAVATGQRVRVTGFSSQFDTHYEIDPRSPADLAVLP